MSLLLIRGVSGGVAVKAASVASRVVDVIIATKQKSALISVKLKQCCAVNILYKQMREQIEKKMLL